MIVRALILSAMLCACGRTDLLQLPAAGGRARDGGVSARDSGVSRRDSGVSGRDAGGPARDAGVNPDAIVDYETFELTTGFDERWDVQLGHVVATGDGFAVAWIENINGQLHLAFALLDATGRPVTQPRTLNTDTHVENVVLAWDGSEVVAFWSQRDGRTNDAHILMRRIGTDGIPLGMPQVVRERAGSFVVMLSAIPARFGGREVIRLMWIDDRETEFMYYPRFLTVDRFGGAVGSETNLLEPTSDYLTYGSVAEGTIVHLPHVLRPVDFSDHHALVARYDALGIAEGPPVEIYSAETLHAGNSLSTPEGIWVALWDYDRGPLIILVTEDRAPQTFDVAGDRSPMLARRDSELGILSATGPNGELPTGLVFQKRNAAGMLRPSKVLSAVPSEAGACMEGALLAGGRPGFLAMWQEGCSRPRGVYVLRVD